MSWKPHGGDVINVLTVLLSGALAALIGTFSGAHFLYKEKYDSVRKIAIKALNVFKKYAKKSYKKQRINLITN